MEYQPPPAFGPPESRVGPLRPDQAMALLSEQQAYAHPPLYPPPADSPYTRPPPTPWGRLVAGAVIATVLVATGIIVLFGASGGAHVHAQHAIELPASVGDYHLIRSVDPRTVESILGNQIGSLGSLQDAIDTAKVGTYGLGTNGLPTIVFLGFNAADSAGIRQLLAAGPDGVVTEIMSGAGSSVGRAFAPGPLGGALQCAQATKNGTAFTPCAWADGSTLALVLRIGTVDVSEAGALTLQFRAAAEH